MKIQTSIDPKLIAMLGRKLYSSHPVPIIVRELLQNSIDACNRAGVEPVISIKVEQLTDRQVIITCDDNGCGMTPEEIISDFLCLGGTNKRGTGSVGGFGIAKAAIMSGVSWSVETLDWIFDSNDMIEGNDIREVSSPRKGTKITVELDEQTYSWNIEEMLRLIYTSSVNIELTVLSSRMTTIYDSSAGLKALPLSMIKNDRWEAFGVEAMEYGNGHPIHGRNFVRVNGLTQFQVSSYVDSRESNFLIDIYTDENPDSKSYPLTVSREKLTDTIQTEVLQWLRQFEGESASTDLQIKRLILPDDVTIIPGALLVGERTKFANNSGSGSGIGVGNEDFEKIQEFISEIILEREKAMESLSEYINEGSDHSILMMRNYAPKPENIQQDSNILSVWNSLLKTIIPVGNVFGTGFVGDNQVISSINMETKVPFFLVNPNNILKNSRSPRSAIIHLWTSCCHELSHLTEYRHSEEFCMVWQELMSLTSEDIISKVDILANSLMGKV